MSSSKNSPCHIINPNKKNKKVLISHDNHFGELTEQSHEFGEQFYQCPNLQPLIDTDYWSKDDKPNPIIDQIKEIEMCLEATFGIRIFYPYLETKQTRRKGPIRESNFMKNHGKCMVNIFKDGAKRGPNDSPFNPNKDIDIRLNQDGFISERHYRKINKELERKGCV